MDERKSRKHMLLTTETSSWAPLPHRETARQESGATFGLFWWHILMDVSWSGCAFFPRACARLLKSFHTFFLSCSNQALISKLSLIGQNRLFGWCGSACPQNVPPLCHSKDWEDAAGCGHNEEGRGWHRLEKEKPWAPKAGSHKEHSHMS